jgi:hypothetical protein
LFIFIAQKLYSISPKWASQHRRHSAISSIANLAYQAFWLFEILQFTQKKAKVSCVLSESPFLESAVAKLIFFSQEFSPEPY